MARKSDDTVIETAMKRWRLAEEAESDMRRQSLDDLRFSTGQAEFQWPGSYLTQRSLDNRPCLVVDKISPAVKQITNDQRQNRPSIKIVAVDDTDDDTADVWEGLIRHIQTDSNADVAYDTACDFQVRMGYGYFRIITEYSDEMSMDQDIKIKPIANPFTVYDDPGATEADRRDRKWLFITSDILKDEYKQDYAGDASFMSVGDGTPGWMGVDYIRIAEYFEVVETPMTIVQLSNGKHIKVVDKEEWEANPNGMYTGFTKLRERESTKKKVIWRKINGFEVLEEKEWPGKYIPIVGVYGEEIDIDGKKMLKGLVRNAKDPQRMYNYWTSAQTEAIALAPKAPWMAAEGQLEGYEDDYRASNVKNIPVLYYRTRDVNGIEVGAPQRQMAEPPIQAMSLALRQASDDIKATTGLYDPSLGMNQGDQSGKAIMALNREGDTSNLHFQDNLARAMKFAGDIIIDMGPVIYDAERLMRIVHADQTSESVMLNAPHKGEDGVERFYDMKTGKFDISVDVGPSYQTRKQEAVASMLEFVQSFPQAAPLLGDLIAKAGDWADHDVVAERLHTLLPPALQDNTGDIPPQAQAQMKQMGQMVQALTQTVHKLMDEKDSKAAELQSKEKIAGINANAGITEAIIAQAGAANQRFVERELDRIDASSDFHRQDFAARRDAALNVASQPPQPDPQPQADP